jgi:hypothetical protein
MQLGKKSRGRQEGSSSGGDGVGLILGGRTAAPYAAEHLTTVGAPVMGFWVVEIRPVPIRAPRPGPSHMRAWLASPGLIASAAHRCDWEELQRRCLRVEMGEQLVLELVLELALELELELALELSCCGPLHCTPKSQRWPRARARNGAGAEHLVRRVRAAIGLPEPYLLPLPGPRPRPRPRPLVSVQSLSV